MEALQEITQENLQVGIIVQLELGNLEIGTYYRLIYLWHHI